MKHFGLGLWVSAFALVALTACGSDGGGDDGAADAISDGGTTGGATGGTTGGATGGTTGGDTGGLPPDCELEATFASISDKYFQVSCNFSSCHGAAQAGGLNLDPAVAYSQLVGVNATHAGAKGEVRVTPGDPEASFLYRKISGVDPSQGLLMPLGEQKPYDLECRVEAVRQWILAGAPEN